MAEIANPWLPLAAEDALWPTAWPDRAAREEVLERLAAGEIALAVSAGDGNAIFRLRDFAGEKYLVPQRYTAALDFLARGVLRRGSTQADALEILATGNHLLLTGGPGTGKSYTLANFISAL